MKNMLLFAALAVSIGAGASAHAAVANDKSRTGKNDCVFARTINDFKVLDRNKMVIWAPTRSKAYLVELSMPLPELKFANRIAVVDRNHDGMLCGYGMDRIIVADSTAAGFRTPATIMGMKRLDDAELAQLEQQYDVRLTRKKVAQAPGGSAEEQPESKPEGNPQSP
jgi:hypothetical protein